MQSERIPVGIVGCGRVAEHHLRHLSNRRNVDVVALADANAANARRLAGLYGVPHVFASLEAMLDAQPVRVVHVLTPPDSHLALATASVERGVHVLVEKPLTLRPDEARELMARAAARQVMVVPDFIQLFHPRMVEATQLIESGRMGRVVSVECHFGLDLDMPELREARGLHWSYQLPGGVLQNYVTHPLYLVMRWSGAPRQLHVAARHTGTLPQGLTDQLDMLIEGEKANAYVSVSLAAQPSPYSVRIFCDRGTVLVDFSALSVLTVRHGVLPRSLARILPLQALPMMRWTTRNVVDTMSKRLLPYHGLRVLFDLLYDAVATGGPPPVSPELTLAVCEAEHAVLSRAGRLHVNTKARPSSQANVRRAERVLVTGAGGYVGRRVVARLVQEGYYVRALVRPLSRIESLERLGVEICFADLRDSDAVARACEGMDVVVHVAAAIRGTPEFMRESTVGGTRNVAQGARAAGVKRVVYISSMAVYDFGAITRHAPVTADTPLESRAEERGVASAVKREAEDIALAEAHASGWTILRPSLIFGGDRDALGMLGPVKGGRVICLGAPRTRLRLVHVDDVASAVAVVLQTEASRGRVYTLSHPETLTYRDYFAALPRHATNGVKPVYLRRWFVSSAALGMRVLNRVRGRRGGMSPRQVQYLFADVAVDSSAIRALGWEPSASLREQVAGQQ